MKKSKLMILSVCSLLSFSAIASCSNSPSDPSGSDGSQSIKTYKVTFEQNSDYSIIGINDSGYESGDTVTFSISLNNEGKAIEKVTANEIELEEDSGSYSFAMPEENVVISVSLIELTVTGISLNKKEITLNLDDHQEETLEVSFLPNGAKGEIVWDSSDASVVSVQDGKLKALKNGEATITAQLLSDFEVKDTCFVTVESNFIDYSFQGIDAVVKSGSKNLKENIVGFEGSDSIVSIDFVIEAEKESNFELGINVSANSSAYKATDVFKITLNDERIASNANTKIGTCWSDYSEITLGMYRLNKGENTISVSFDKSFTDWQTFNFKSLELHAPQTLTFKNKQEPIRMSSITLDRHELSVEFEANKVLKLNATIAPSEASSKYIQWKSSDNGIASVDGEGNVTIKGIGNATITASCTYNSDIKDSCLINVTTKQNVYTFNAIDDKVLVDEGSKSASENCVGVSSSYGAHIVYTIHSDEAGKINLSTMVSSHNVARRFTDVYELKINGVSQNSDGMIPVGEMWSGYTNILLGSFDVVEGENTIEFTYLQQALTYNSYNFRSINITSDNVITLMETKKPATKNTLTILANDSNVATNGSTDAEGAIGAIGFDTVKIVNKVRSDRAGKATLKATLSSSPDGRAISSIYNVKVNDVAITPLGNFIVGSQWGSYLEYKLGEIDLIEGENTIEFSYDSNVSQAWTYNYKGISLESEAALSLLNANENIENVTLSQTEATLKAGAELTLSATITPDTVLNKKVNWTSTNEEVATVDKNGVVSALKEGTTEIVASAVTDPTKKATCSITVIGTMNDYTFNAIDDKVLVDIGEKKADEDCVAVDTNYSAHIVYKFTSDKAGKIKLSSTASCHDAARNFIDVYEIKINGKAISSSAVLPAGTMRSQYVQVSLGEFDIVDGENTIEITYKQQALTWQSYNFRGIQISSECQIELLDANS